MTTGVLLTSPIVQFFDNTGAPAVNGSVLTQVGGGNAATFQDVGLTTQMPNPIPLNSRGEVSTSFGASSQCFLTPNVTYTATLFDSGGNQIWVATYVNGVQVAITQAAIGAGLWPFNATFDGAPVVNTGWTYGDPRRFGAAMDGVTDDTAALNAWASGAGTLTFPAQTALISGEITLQSNTTIVGVAGSVVLQTVANLAHFRATSKSNILVKGIHFKQTTWGASAYVAGVVYDSSLRCQVLECEFEGMQWAGVYLRAGQFCTVRGNQFHDSFPQQAITLTAAPTAGATNGTLTANWALPSGAYTVAFIETAGGAIEGRQVTLANGATSANWAGGGGALGANCNAAITVQAATDSADINVHSSPSAAANYNVIDGNFCNGNTFEVGISVQDPYNGVLPTRNIVTNNRITGHLGYGVLVYMPDAGDSYNQIIGNFIENITGSFALNVSTGAGIYVTGAGIGGTVIVGNTIRNCCINTANASLAPAAIGIAGTIGTTGTAGVPLTVNGNTISDMSQYHGILITGLGQGAAVNGNGIRMPAANPNGHGITITNSDGIACAGNTIFITSTTNANRGYLIQGLGGVNCTNVSIAGGAVRGGHFAQIETTGTGGGLVVGLTVAGVTLDEGDASCICIQLASATDAAITGNFMHSTTALVVNQAACLNVVYSGNRFKGATNVLQLTSTNTGTLVDKNNRGLAAAGINNAGTGAIVELLLSAVPASGTFAVGDRVVQSVPVVGNPKGWRCTVLGTPGTWVSEGNL